MAGSAASAAVAARGPAGPGLAAGAVATRGASAAVAARDPDAAGLAAGAAAADAAMAMAMADAAAAVLGGPVRLLGRRPLVGGWELQLLCWLTVIWSGATTLIPWGEAHTLIFF